MHIFHEALLEKNGIEYTQLLMEEIRFSDKVTEFGILDPQGRKSLVSSFPFISLMLLPGFQKMGLISDYIFPDLLISGQGTAEERRVVFSFHRLVGGKGGVYFYEGFISMYFKHFYITMLL